MPVHLHVSKYVSKLSVIDCKHKHIVVDFKIINNLGTPHAIGPKTEISGVMNCHHIKLLIVIWPVEGLCGFMNFKKNGFSSTITVVFCAK